MSLLPCPFCEGPPVALCVRGIGGGAFPDSAIDAQDGLFAHTYVFCHECGAQGPIIESIVYDRRDVDQLLDSAREAWNQRDARHRHLYGASLARLEAAAKNRTVAE